MARPIGVYRMRDEAGGDDKVLVDLEPGKATEPGGWEDPATARRLVEEARACHAR